MEEQCYRCKATTSTPVYCAVNDKAVKQLSLCRRCAAAVIEKALFIEGDKWKEFVGAM